MIRNPINIDALQAFLAANPRIVVLTGAGISLAAGIPTYRDREGIWRHSEPIKHQEFLADAAKRQRYWARSMQGWPTVHDAQPSAAHLALAKLERAGNIDTIITQNVDRLHQRAGSQRVIDLHGRLDRVLCLDCGRTQSREQLQTRLRQNNTAVKETSTLRPDGDTDLPAEIERQFRVPNCSNCTGILKPDVVFFGGTVPRATVQACMDAIERADALLTIGSSLQVFSGFRFCRRAYELGKPLAIINPGRTRADEMAHLKMTEDCQLLLDAVAFSTPQADARRSY